ncbi:MAG: putative ABC transporter permease [Lachnospiraceae bacterium]
MMTKVELLALGMVIAVVSFLGFAVENLWLSLTKGYMDNRNMCFPFLIGYGLAVVAIYLLFGTPQNLLLCGRKLALRSQIGRKIIYVLLVMGCICIGEILLGTFVEKTCHFYWWDYSKLPLHITRYTTIPTSLGFSLMIAIFMDHAFEPLFKSFQTWNYETLRFTVSLLMAAMVWDFTYNAYRMYRDKRMITRWRVDTTRTKGYRLLHPCTTESSGN